jgi:hypothetical protein
MAGAASNCGGQQRRNQRKTENARNEYVHHGNVHLKDVIEGEIDFRQKKTSFE